MKNLLLLIAVVSSSFAFGHKKAVQFIPPPVTDSPTKAEAQENIAIEDSKKCFVYVSEVQKDEKVDVTETQLEYGYVKFQTKYHQP
ncbi:hypothetical protein [Chryseobacterium sp. FH1]|uniref:hypothetical protein n=1 Tax=Chryseobacterium sp. FH1 TaxID=1233951 RepID=UPI0004E39323|nr:hypothetical protein [Chryseobacterium sp. FH1]KFC19458.1 hypothetical protein IO90_09180 [Chryseobacterium sp. FH1]